MFFLSSVLIKTFQDQGGMFIGMRDHDAIASNLMMQVPKLEDLCTNNLLKMFY